MLGVDPGARQLGVGIYISPVFHDWPPAGTDYKENDYWDCRVTADDGFWDTLQKAWVPSQFEVPEDSDMKLHHSPRQTNCSSSIFQLWGMVWYLKCKP